MSVTPDDVQSIVGDLQDLRLEEPEPRGTGDSDRSSED